MKLHALPGSPSEDSSLSGFNAEMPRFVSSTSRAPRYTFQQTSNASSSFTPITTLRPPCHSEGGFCPRNLLLSFPSIPNDNHKIEAFNTLPSPKNQPPFASERSPRAQSPSSLQSSPAEFLLSASRNSLQCYELSRLVTRPICARKLPRCWTNGWKKLPLPCSQGGCWSTANGKLRPRNRARPSRRSALVRPIISSRIRRLPEANFRKKG